MQGQKVQASDLPSVTLILLNWNAVRYLPACLNSLERLTYPHYKIVFVDNASSDDSVAFVKEHFPQVQIIQCTTNRGFASGNNVALRQLDTDVAVLINPDIVVEPDWLQKMMLPVLADERIGVAGCQLTYPDGKTVQYAGGELTRPQWFPRQKGAEALKSSEANDVHDVDYVIGAAMLIRRNVLAEVGLLDEGYFLYFEDTDFCTRVRRAGRRVVHVPTVQARHFESATTGSRSHFYFRHMYRSRWRYLLKHVDFATILNEVLPAERSWLASLPSFQRSAAAHAYYVNLSGWSEVLNARQRDGQSMPQPRQLSAVKTALQQLRDDAWKPTIASALSLPEHSQLQPRPFSSHMPLIGSLVARLRHYWNKIETELYVRPLLAQQNRLNQQISRWLAAHSKQLATHEVNQEKLLKDIANLQLQMKESNRLIQSIQDRLERLEKKS